MGICVVIPAYNAVDTIRHVVLETLEYGFPVLVVNDGSTDGTVAAITDLPIDILSHKVKSGKGAALKTGFAWAVEKGFTGVLTLDSDGQHDPSAIPRLLDAAREGGFAIVLASRFTQFGEMAGLRHYWNRFGAWCMKKRTGFAIDDSQSGFRYYSADLLASVRLAADGYELEMEVLLKAWRGGFLIGSVAVPARVADGRSTSHYRPVRDTWRICMTFLRYM
ncbi:MAG TPA: glycosyltransferase family 2 protein [Geobacteraceae bacterium]|nr:glycosyltransferase family 2 protein [Geobacteraceae bacterium]